MHLKNSSKSNSLVLIADDDKLMRIFLCDILKQDGYNIVEACDGLETIDLFQRYHPNLVLLDIIMPEIDGCSVCAKLRCLPSGKHVPILMITIKEDDDTINNAFAAGADDYITKNFNITVIRYRIKRLLEAEHNRKMVEHLARLDRLNVIGEMAASIGHEIRNPMTTVRGFLQYLSKKNEFKNHQNHFTLMIEELDRANSIITEFLSLAKNRSMNFKTINLNDIIADVSPMIKADALLNNCNIEINLGNIPALFLDQQSIRQLILNMIRNAIEAMPQGGTIRINTANYEKKVLLIIEDQGIGIQPELLDKLGTPFVTTKDTGSGLGLAVCYRIAQRHEARIHIKSELGKGSIFTVGFYPPIPSNEKFSVYTNCYPNNLG